MQGNDVARHCFFDASLDSDICLPLRSLSCPPRRTVPARHPERRPVLGRVELLTHQVGEVRRQVAPHLEFDPVVFPFFFSYSVEERRRAKRERKKSEEKRREKKDKKNEVLTTVRAANPISLSLSLSLSLGLLAP